MDRRVVGTRRASVMRKPALWVLSLAGLAGIHLFLQPIRAALVLSALLVAVGLVWQLRWWNARIEVGRERMRVETPGESLTVPWSDVEAAELDTSGDAPALRVVTGDGLWRIPLPYFPEEEVWRAVRDRLPESALGEPAVEAAWARRREGVRERTAETGGRVVARDRTLFWATGLLTFAACGVTAAALIPTGESTGLGVFMAAFAVAGLAQAGFAGRSAVGPVAVVRETGFGRYRIAWSAVRKVEVASNGSRIVFRGRDEQLAMPGASSWVADDRAAMTDALDTWTDVHDVPVESSEEAALSWSKNTRVGSGRWW